MSFVFSFLIQKRQVILEQNKAAGIKYGLIFKLKTFPALFDRCYTTSIVCQIPFKLLKQLKEMWTLSGQFSTS